jgi:hypothetical protein
MQQCDLIVNREPLGKSGMSSLAGRVAMLEAVVSTRPWLAVVVTDDLHLADIARGYEVLVLGADKWQQLLDPAFYESEDARDRAIERLPRLAVAPRDDLPLPPGCEVLAVDLTGVSSSAARAGNVDLVVPEVRPLLDF